MRTLIVILAVFATTAAVLLSAQARAAEEPFIWIEGEDAAESNVRKNPWLDAVDPEELSGGAWMSSFSEPEQPTGTATYELKVPRSGGYHFWLRANPRGTGLDYRIDGGPWQSVDVKALKAQDKKNRRKEGYSRKVREESNIAIDGGWDARFIAWIDLGKVELPEGRHTVEFRLGGTDAEKRFSAIDCFVLSAEEFEPNRKYRPGEQPENIIEYPPETTWPFEPERDTFREDALLDLRHLNEDVAGEHGFIRQSPDGMGFVRGDGEPIRFWAGTTYVQRNAFRRGRDGWDTLRHHARFLAKRGVNMVRWHGALPPREEDSEITDVREEGLHQAWRLVAAMKEEGIYATLSPFWGSHTGIQPRWDIPDPKNANLSGLVFWVDEVQEGYKAWLKALYDRENPYTGTRLADDPAVAIIQLQNEDSMLFWTMQRVKGEARRELGRQFGEWVVEKYGSLEAARDEWKGNTHKDDDFEDGVVGLYIVWFFTRDAREERGDEVGLQERLSDQLHFMAHTMRSFNEEIERYLREDLGCRQMINAGNWRTADTVVLDPAERWAYAANQVLGKNSYYSPAHLGFQRGWRIRSAHYLKDASAIRNPTRLPLNVKQAVGHPFIIPESLWVPPLSLQAEGPLMVAAQQCLTGVDVFYWFATGKEEWQPPGNKWTFATPMQQGQFPAAALIFRRGYVEEGEPVVYEERGLENIWARKSPIIAEGGSYDPNRDAGDLPADSSIKDGVDPLAFMAGPVHVKYEGDPANNRVADLAELIDHERRTVTSVTGQITTDYGRGLYSVNAPRAQGAAGFLAKAGTVELDEVRIECGNEYAAVVVVALDERPIAESGKLLVQVGTRCRPTGWQARPARFKADEKMMEGKRIIRVGTPPWQVLKTDLTLTVQNAEVGEAVLLDLNGNAVREIPVSRRAGRLTVELPPEAMYVVLR